MKLHNPHDTVFKEVQSNIENAKDFIKGFYPAEIVSNIDFNALELDKTSYTTKELKKYFSDIVYNSAYQIGAKKIAIKITFLIEHKSKPVDYPHLQVLQYMLSIWKLQIKQKKQLTPVLPLLFYHGKRDWDIEPFDEI